jgi:hypothetical protein
MALFQKPIPSGRLELLDWFNTLCRAKYDTLEQLGDGILYTQVLEMCLVDVSPFLQKLGSFDCVDTGTKPSSSSGASAGIQREKRERNLGVFQHHVRRFVPKQQSVEVDVSRLAEGKLQDHMLVAKWLCGFAHRCVEHAIRLRFVSNADARRADAAQGLSTVVPDQVSNEKGTADISRTRSVMPSPKHEQLIEDQTLERLQSLLVAKARKTSALMQHLAQFVEMRDSLLYVTEHVKQEATGALTDPRRSDDAALASFATNLLSEHPVQTRESRRDIDRVACSTFAVLAAALKP